MTRYLDNPDPGRYQHHPGHPEPSRWVDFGWLAAGIVVASGLLVAVCAGGVWAMRVMA